VTRVSSTNTSPWHRHAIIILWVGLWLGQTHRHAIIILWLVWVRQTHLHAIIILWVGQTHQCYIIMLSSSCELDRHISMLSYHAIILWIVWCSTETSACAIIILWVVWVRWTNQLTLTRLASTFVRPSKIFVLAKRFKWWHPMRRRVRTHPLTHTQWTWIMGFGCTVCGKW
jgi:hypothetical protein